MKSKKAQEYANMLLPTHRARAIEAVELAEQDARERVARTFCAECPMSEQPPCLCIRKINFLKHYDDEQG